MENICLNDAIRDLRTTVYVLDDLIDHSDDDELLDVMYHVRAELKLLVYDLEECVDDF